MVMRREADHHEKKGRPSRGEAPMVVTRGIPIDARWIDGHVEKDRSSSEDGSIIATRWVNRGEKSGRCGGQALPSTMTCSHRGALSNAGADAA